jgi:uncharacterized protein YigE (DUF2233 family)
MLLVAVLLGLAAGESTLATPTAWKELAPGVELRMLGVTEPSAVGDSPIAVVRVDPNGWRLELVGQSATGETSGRSAREWARRHGLAVAINGGMFLEDYTTHVGYMEIAGKVISSRINSYQSVAAFDPHDPAKHPPFRIFDLDVPGVSVQSIRADYGSLVQNLRLIKRPGTNRWSQQDKRWSEAALGEDEQGRILFIYSRTPFSMHDLVRELLASGIGVVAAQHLEGGRLAQLYVKVGDVELELFGAIGSSLGEDGGSTSAWPIPNVLGVRRKSAGK